MDTQLMERGDLYNQLQVSNDVINSNILSLMIHAGYKSSDYCRKKLHNLLTWVMYIFCNVAAFIFRMNHQRNFNCLNEKYTYLNELLTLFPCKIKSPTFIKQKKKAIVSCNSSCSVNLTIRTETMSLCKCVSRSFLSKNTISFVFE